EAEGHRVHAVAVAGRRAEAVGEDVAQVRPAAGAAHLGAQLAQAVVVEQLDGVGPYRLVEARPATAGVELRPRGEQLVAAGPARVAPGAVLVEQLARPGPLRRRLAQDRERLGSQPLAPLLLVVLDLVAHVHLPFARG